MPLPRLAPRGGSFKKKSRLALSFIILVDNEAMLPAWIEELNEQQKALRFKHTAAPDTLLTDATVPGACMVRPSSSRPLSVGLPAWGLSRIVLWPSN